MIKNPESLKVIDSRYMINRIKISKKIDSFINFNKIIYVFAPIGTGKTIAVNYYVKDFTNNVIWYELEEKDNNNVELLKSLFDMIRESKDNKRKILIFDNFDIINNEEILEEFYKLISKSSAIFKFIFLSRRKIPTCFSSFIAKSMIQLINVEDLYFNEMETKQFYSKNGVNITDNKIRKIINNTGGWASIINIFLVCIKLNLTTNLNDLFIDNEYVDYFLRQNIWNKWNDKIKYFFMVVSLFDEVELDQCKEITGMKEANELLDEVMNTKKDNKYRLNPIFLNFLKHRCDELDPSEFIEVYKKAGVWFKKNGFILDAAKSYYNAKDFKVNQELSSIHLTKSEIQILFLLNKGMSNIEISQYLNIKKDTVKFHIKNIYSKLNVKNRLKAVLVAKKIGIIKD